MNRSIWKPCVAVALLTWGIALVLPEPWLDWSDTPSRTRMPEVRARAVQWEGFTRWRDGGILLVHDTRLWTDRFPASEAVELRLERIWGDPHFDLDFGRLPSGLLSFRHHPASERRGVFLMRDDGGEEALLTDFPAHYPTRIHKLALRVEGTRLELELDGNRAQAELPTSLSEIFGEVHCHTGVVRGDMGLGSITIEAGGRTEARADFSHFPIILDLGFRLSERANDRLPRSLFVSLLALAAGLATRAGRAISSAGEVEDFDFLPLQLAALLVMARLFNLPLSIALLFALLWALLRVDQAIRGSRPDGPFSRRHRGLLLLSPIVLALTVLHLIDPTLDTPTSSPHAVWVVPVFVIATLVGIWGSPGFPRTSALRHAAQWGLLPLVELAQPGHHHVPLAAAIALPWTLFVAGRVLVRRGRWFVSLPLSILGFGLFATCLEWALRAESAPLVSLRLDYPERIQSIFWNVEEHTDLLDNHRHQETLFFREVEFAREKPPGVTRIVCLGSSSTWASGLPEDPAHGYPYELGEILAAGGARVEVINGGIQGAGLFMLSTYLRDVLLELDPDLVILYYGKNTEMQFNHTMLPVMERLVEEHPWIDSSMEMAAAMELRWPGRIMVWAYLRAMDLRSFVLLREAAIAVADRLRDEEDLRRAEELTPWRSLSVPWMPGLTDLAPTTRRVVEMCRARQVKVLLVPEIVDPELWPDEIPYRAIFADLADPPAVTLLRVDERMLEPPRSEVFLDDVHLTDEGCRILAAALTPTVLSLLPALLPEAGDTVAPGDAEAGADGGPVPPAPD